MRSQTSTPACKQRQSRRLLLVGGFTVPAIVLGSMLGASSAFADPQSKTDLTSAFSAAPSADSTSPATFALGNDLTDPASDGTSDVQTLGAGKALTIDLKGHTLELDQIVVGAGAKLTVIDTGSSHGALEVGTAGLTPGDNGGIRLSKDAGFTADQGAQVTTDGSTNLPGVGTVSAAATGSTVTVTGGASLTANGGAGAAGVGGAATGTVTADGGTIVANGGAGAAGIGGSANTPGSTVTVKHSATVTATGGSATGSATEAANAIGNGQGSTDFGALSVEAGSTVVLPTHSVENVPAGGVIANAGEIDTFGTLRGEGRVDNTGAILTGAHGTVADDLNITGNDYAVTLDAGDSGSVTPTKARVLADTFEDGGVPLPDPTPTTGFHFTAWKAGSDAVGSTDQLASTAVPAANGSKAVALTAAYGTLVSFSQSPNLGYLSTTTSISKQLTAVGTDNSDGTKTWSVASDSALPVGLSLSASGLLTGTPTTPGAFSLKVDVAGPYNTLAQTYTGTVGVAPVMSDTTLPSTKVGADYSQSIAATSGTEGTTYTSTTLPDGLVLDSNGTLHGTPSASAGGTKTFEVTASNHFGTSHATYTLLTNTIPVFTTTTLPPAVLGQSYSQQITAVGDGSIDYAVDPSTPLPSRLTLTRGGLLSGIASKSVNTTITVLAHSEFGTTRQALVFVAGDVPAITTANLPNPTVGDSHYSQQLTTTGNGTITWTSADLPAGLHLSDSGLLTGPISVAGTYTFTVTSTSSFGTVDKDFTITAGAKPAISTTSIANPVQSDSYSAPLAFTGDDHPVFSATGLPAGLSIGSGTGIISGTPTAGAGTAHVVVTATSVWGTDTAAFDITVHVKPTWVTPTALPDVPTGNAIDLQLAATGSGDTRFASADLPSTLSLTATGHLTGHVDASKSFTVTATNDYGSAPDRTFTITAGDAPHITTAASGIAAPTLNDGSYSATIAATGDGSPTFSVTSGHLPTGLDIDRATGVISGKPTAAGSFTFEITAHSHWGDDPKSYTVLVGAPPAIQSASLRNPTLGAHYDQAVNTAVTPGTTVSFSADGDLPHGLSLDAATGHITGDVAADAVAKTFTVTVHTVYGDDHAEYTLTPGHPAHITTATADLGTPVAGRAFTASVAGTGDGVTYAVTAGDLPAGLHLSHDGAITGTPTSTVAAHFTVTASSEYGDDSADYTLTAATPPTFSTASLPWAVAGQHYSQVIAATGTGAVTLHVQGDLPAGLAFDTGTGTLSGTPTATGAATITIVGVSDLATTTQQYTFTAVGAPAFSTAALPNGTAGTAYRTAVLAAGDGTMTYSVTSGALPEGLVLDGRTGAISGTPTTAGTARFTVIATSDYGHDAKQLTLTVDAAPVASTPTPVSSAPASSAPASPAPTTPAPVASAPAPAAPQLPVAPKQTAKLGHPFSLSVKASSTVAVTYTVKGALPKGVALDRKTGVISGTPTQDGTFAFTVTAKSAAGSDTQAYKVVVPQLVQLIAGTANWVTPVQGQPFDVTVKGLKKGERWTVRANDKVVATGKAAKAGTVTTAVTLGRSLRDKAYTIRVSGSRAVTDPATTASDEFVVTAITAKKTLKLKRVSGAIQVTNLAGNEQVTVTANGKQVAAGRADKTGLFVYTPSWKTGTHTVVATGKTTTRAGKLIVKLKK